MKINFDVDIDLELDSWGYTVDRLVKDEIVKELRKAVRATLKTTDPALKRLIEISKTKVIQGLERSLCENDS